jgi:hypothetical protein
MIRNVGIVSLNPARLWQKVRMVDLT